MAWILKQSAHGRLNDLEDGRPDDDEDEEAEHDRADGRRIVGRLRLPQPQRMRRRARDSLTRPLQRTRTLLLFFTRPLFVTFWLNFCEASFLALG